MKINKKTILIAVVILVLGFGAWRIFLKKPAPSFTVEIVSRGDVIQDVSESGVVKMGQDLVLSFRGGGSIKKIYANVGDEVSPGQLLAELNTDQLTIRISSAKANVTAAKAQAQASQTALSNAQTALQAAQQGLNDATASAQISLQNTYQDALNSLDNAYLTIYNALETVKTIQQAYFYTDTQASLDVRNAVNSIQTDLDDSKAALDKAKVTSDNNDIEGALSVMSESLSDTASALATIRQTIYSAAVSATYVTALDTQRGNINTVIVAISNAQQAISSVKVANSASVNTANSQLAAAQGSLKQAQDSVVLYAAQVTQAQSQLDLLSSQLQDSSIYAPATGKITQISMKEGETVQPSAPVFSFMTQGTVQIETDIYEGDIVKVKVGDPVSMDITAFPDRTFSGNVISIDPAQELIEGVVYYKVTNSIDNAPEEIRPGMTVDVTIKTAEKNDVLTISGSALISKDGKTFVQLVENGATTTEKEVQIGLEGDNNLVEVMSGLQEGEQIAIPK